MPRSAGRYQFPQKNSKLAPHRERPVNPEPHPLDLAALRRALIALAMEQRTAPYAELVQQLRVPPPRAIARLTGALEALAREDLLAGRPLLAVVAVSKGQKGLPGEGFFLRLVEWGVFPAAGSPAERAAWHRQELGRVRAYWPGRLAGGPGEDSLN